MQGWRDRMRGPWDQGSNLTAETLFPLEEILSFSSSEALSTWTQHAIAQKVWVLGLKCKKAQAFSLAAETLAKTPTVHVGVLDLMPSSPPNSRFLLIWIMADRHDGSSWVPASDVRDSFWLPASVPAPGQRGHLWSEPVNRSLSLCLLSKWIFKPNLIQLLDI